MQPAEQLTGQPSVDEVLADLKQGETAILTDIVGWGPCTTKLAGVGPGNGVIVNAPTIGPDLILSDGRELEFRGFTSRHVITFRTEVVEISDKPFPYWYLRYPDKVEIHGNRNHVRQRSELFASVFALRKLREAAVPVFVTDLSEGGARVRTRHILGEIGEVLRFEIWLSLLGGSMGSLVIDAEIVGYSDGSRDGFQNRSAAGYSLKFTHMSEDYKMRLKALLYAIGRKGPVEGARGVLERHQLAAQAASVKAVFERHASAFGHSSHDHAMVGVN